MDVQSFLHIAPLLIILLFGVVIILLDLSAIPISVYASTLVFCPLALYFTKYQFVKPTVSFDSLIRVDGISGIFYLLIIYSLTSVLILGSRQEKGEGIEASVDSKALMVFAAFGAMVMVSAANLMVLFVGFETLSVAVYVLAALARKNSDSTEAGLKYFILGAFSSAFLLYGMVLIFAATGTMQLADIYSYLSSSLSSNSESTSLIFKLGVGLILFGFAFKISAAPFHFWTPDVYQGSPTTVTTFMASAVKVAAFGAMLRVFGISFIETSLDWSRAIAIISVLSMTIGNFAAIRQNSLKRMLAYSSIAHAGYALIGLVSLKTDGASALIFYVFIYTIMTIVSFGVVFISKLGIENSSDDIKGLSSLGWKNPALAFIMLISLLSLAGMPPLAGFSAKLFIFKSAVTSGYTWLALVAALNSVVSLYYYLRVVVFMYFPQENTEEEFAKKIPLSHMSVVTVGAMFIVLIGFLPSTLMDLSIVAVESLKML